MMNQLVYNGSGGNTLYKMFKEGGYINYDVYTKESDTEASEGTEYNLVLASKINKSKVNFYVVRPNDVCDNDDCIKRLFENQKPIDVNEVTKQMIVLDSGATNGVCPHEDLCCNVRLEKNEMICGGGNEMNSNKIGDIVIKGND